MIELKRLQDFVLSVIGTITLVIILIVFFTISLSFINKSNYDEIIAVSLCFVSAIFILANNVYKHYKAVCEYINQVCMLAIAALDNKHPEDDYYDIKLINVFLDIALPLYDMSKIQSLLFYENTYIKKVIFQYTEITRIEWHYPIKPPLDTYQLIDIDNKTLGFYRSSGTNVYKVELIEEHDIIAFMRCFDKKFISKLINDHVSHKESKFKSTITIKRLDAIPKPNKNIKPTLRLIKGIEE